MTTTNDAQDFRRSGQLEAEKMRAHLRKMMKESKLSRKEIAERAGTTPAVLSGVLRTGGPGLYVDRVFHILEAIEVDPLEFYGELYPEAFEGVGRPQSA